MQMAQKSWKIEEIFPRFVNAQMAKGVSDKTVLAYNRHFRSLGYHLDMTMTFDELTKEALDSMLVSLRKSDVSPNTISSYASRCSPPYMEKTRLVYVFRSICLNTSSPSLGSPVKRMSFMRSTR